MSLKNISLIVCFTLLSGCVSTMMTMDSISTIRKGITPEEVQELTGREPVIQGVIEHGGRNYFADLYSMQIGTRQQTAVYCTSYGCYPYITTVPVTEPYIFLYDINKKLFTWGFPKEGNQAEFSELYKLSYTELSKSLVELQKSNISENHNGNKD